MDPSGPGGGGGGPIYHHPASRSPSPFAHRAPLHHHQEQNVVSSSNFSLQPATSSSSSLASSSSAQNPPSQPWPANAPAAVAAQFAPQDASGSTPPPMYIGAGTSAAPGGWGPPGMAGGGSPAPTGGWGSPAVGVQRRRRGSLPLSLPSHMTRGARIGSGGIPTYPGHGPSNSGGGAASSVSPQRGGVGVPGYGARGQRPSFSGLGRTARFLAPGESEDTTAAAVVAAAAHYHDMDRCPTTRTLPTLVKVSFGDGEVGTVQQHLESLKVVLDEEMNHASSDPPGFAPSPLSAPPSFSALITGTEVCFVFPGGGSDADRAFMVLSHAVAGGNESSNSPTATATCEGGKEDETSSTPSSGFLAAVVAASPSVTTEVVRPEQAVVLKETPAALSGSAIRGQVEKFGAVLHVALEASTGNATVYYSEKSAAQKALSDLRTLRVLGDDFSVEAVPFGEGSVVGEAPPSQEQLVSGSSQASMVSGSSNFSTVYRAGVSRDPRPFQMGDSSVPPPPDRAQMTPGIPLPFDRAPVSARQGRRASIPGNLEELAAQRFPPNQQHIPHHHHSAVSPGLPRHPQHPHIGHQTPQPHADGMVSLPGSRPMSSSGSRTPYGAAPTYSNPGSVASSTAGRSASPSPFPYPSLHGHGHGSHHGHSDRSGGSGMSPTGMHSGGMSGAVHPSGLLSHGLTHPRRAGSANGSQRGASGEPPGGEGMMDNYRIPGDHPHLGGAPMLRRRKSIASGAISREARLVYPGAPSHHGHQSHPHPHHGAPTPVRMHLHHQQQHHHDGDGGMVGGEQPRVFDNGRGGGTGYNSGSSVGGGPPTPPVSHINSVNMRPNSRHSPSPHRHRSNTRGSSGSPAPPVAHFLPGGGHPLPSAGSYHPAQHPSEIPHGHMMQPVYPHHPHHPTPQFDPYTGRPLSHHHLLPQQHPGVVVNPGTGMPSSFGHHHFQPNSNSNNTLQYPAAPYPGTAHHHHGSPRGPYGGQQQQQQHIPRATPSQPSSRNGKTGGAGTSSRPAHRNNPSGGSHPGSRRSQPSNPGVFKIDLGKVKNGEDSRGTLMVRNIPNKYTQAMLLDELREGLPHGAIDFFYLPIDFKNGCGVGYAFVNLINPKQHLPDFHALFQGRSWSHFNSVKICALAYARIQGKSSLVSHFSNSGVMLEPEKYRPRVSGESGGSLVPLKPAPGSRFGPGGSGSRRRKH